VTTLLLVHGVGARDAGRLPVLRLTDAVAAKNPKVRVRLCYWGDRFGAELLAGGASVPAEPSEVADPTDADLWALLDKDPLCEIRWLAATQPPVSKPSPPHLRPLGQELARTVAKIVTDQALADDHDLIEELVAAGLDNVIAGAATVVLDAEPTKAVLREAAEPAGKLRSALARAVVATAMARAGVPGQPLELDGWTVGVIVDMITDRIGGPEALVPGRRSTGFARWAGEAAASQATRWARRNHGRLAFGITPYAGDVVKYLANGAGLRALIRTAIADAEPPVVVVGHSLGGVACVDLLAMPDAPKVDALITLGSQAPYLYEIDALPQLRFGEQLPKLFPRWVNVFDHDDLLAFAAGGLFSGHAADRIVDNRAPFPRAHSAYFSNPEVHRLIAEVLS
jgi:pimeloyl-ACP methyl ester carboxylesterase